ncbi:3-isopropylmalate dehydratase large subunit [bacterium]|nr:3-isopropylmalate dehydratase large subunit [bacterium]
MGKTLYDKIWDAHVITKTDENRSIIYVDKHLIHEVTSPQAFTGLNLNKRAVRRPEMILATADHSIPTLKSAGYVNQEAQTQVEVLRENCIQNGIRFFDVGDINQGIIHVIAPELGAVIPGTVVVCGDSHTSTHGAFGALAFGIGTSEVEHVLATQALQQEKSNNFLVNFTGKLNPWVSAKDMALALIGQIGTKGGTGYVIEYAGEAVKNLSMEGRMTLCNLTIECGARSGLIAADEKTFLYLKNRMNFPSEEAWMDAVKYWSQLSTDADAKYDRSITIDVTTIEPQVTWGTSPEQVVGINENIPDPDDFENQESRTACKQALEYMGIKAGTPLTDVIVDVVFIGSCTNGRIEDFRDAAKVLNGKKIQKGMIAIAVPGSGRVKEQAEKEGLDEVFKSAGFEWREPGCSMCLAMNGDKLAPGQRSASTSNRNFEGRQGKGGRTHLVSPAMAAAAAINGRFTDVRQYM